MILKIKFILDNKSLITGAIVGLVVGMIISPIFLGMIRGTENSTADIKSAGTIDQYFIEQIIPHHEGAIAMAQVALQKSKRPEILSLAQGIIDAQAKEISDMQKKYETWFGSASAHTQHHDGMPLASMEGEIEVLKASKNFDLEFIRQMIPHHEMAVMMAEMLQSSTAQSEMKILADQIITSQTREIEMMRSWEKA